MAKTSVMFLILVSVIMLAGCSAAQDGGLKKAPDFSLPDINGKTIRLSDYNNKVVMLNFFATWCPPCREEIPDFIELINTKDNEDFIIIGISVEKGDDATVRKFASEKKINYPVLIDDGLVSNTYGPIHSIPTTFIVDKNGNIVEKIIGSRTKVEFERMIEPLL